MLNMEYRAMIESNTKKVISLQGEDLSHKSSDYAQSGYSTDEGMLSTSELDRSRPSSVADFTSRPSSRNEALAVSDPMFQEFSSDDHTGMGLDFHKNDDGPHEDDRDNFTPDTPMRGGIISSFLFIVIYWHYSNLYLVSTSFTEFSEFPIFHVVNLSEQLFVFETALRQVLKQLECVFQVILTKLLIGVRHLSLNTCRAKTSAYMTCCVSCIISVLNGSTSKSLRTQGADFAALLFTLSVMLLDRVGRTAYLARFSISLNTMCLSVQKNRPWTKSVVMVVFWAANWSV